MEKIKLENLKCNYEIDAELYEDENEPQNIKDCFIICHGFGSSKESNSVKIIAEKLLLKNIPSMSFDFPNHGESTASFNNLRLDNCMDDIDMIYNFLKDRYVNANVSIFGVSFGSYVILNKINKSQNKFKNIVLRSPAIDMENIFLNSLLKDSFEDFCEKKIGHAARNGKVMVCYDFYNDLKQNNLFKQYNCDAKILIIQGSIDDTAPIKDTINFVEKNKNNLILKIMDGANHKMTLDEMEMVGDMLLEYLK